MIGADSATIGISLSWDGGTTYTSEKTIVFSSLDIENTHYPNMVVRYAGATDDDWGRTWTAQELSNDNFRVKIRLVAKSGIANGVALDYVKANVYFLKNLIKTQGVVNSTKLVLSG